MVIIKTMKTLIIAAAIALLASSSQADPRTVTGPARVIDGDTVVVAGTHVRLKGVDAAELGTERGENAKQVMSSIVTGELTCHLTGEKTWNGKLPTALRQTAQTSIRRSSPKVPRWRARDTILVT